MPDINVDALILTIHSASVAPDGWSRVGRELLSGLSAQSGMGLRVPSLAHPEPWAVLIDYDQIAATEYAKHWAPLDPWYHGARRSGRIRTGLVSVGSQFVSADELAASAFFSEYLRPLDIGHMIQVCLSGSEPNGSIGQAALSMYRGIGQEPFSEQDMRLLSLLAPHLSVAAKNYWSAQTLRLLSGARAHALDAVAAAVFALNHSGKLLFANRLGENMIRQCAWVRVLHERLVPIPTVHPLDRFAAALSSVSSGLGCEFLMTDLTTGAEAHIAIAPLPADTDFGFLPTPPYALVWITPVAPRQDVGGDMARLFDLTPAERRILDKLIAGDDLLEAAASLRISIHTARTQLKSMFRKTGRRSQGQLLMLAARIATLSSTRG